MLEFLRNLFSRDFMPHGVCFLWDPTVLWLNVISDGLIAAAYYAIPFLLFRFARARRDIPFNWIFVAFGFFILACGTTHLLGALTVFVPIYRVDGVVKAITAIASLATFLLLIPLLPVLVALPSPSALAREIESRRAAEEEVRRINRELEERVETRTTQLARSEARLRQQTDLLPQMAWVSAANGEALYFNRRWTEYTGVEERTHETLFPTLHPDDRDQVLALWWESVQAGTPLEVEYRVRGADGNYRWFLGRGLPLLDEEGKIHQWLGTLTDIDDQKRHAISLRTAYDRLQVEMTSRKRVEQQLVQAQKMEAIGRLAGGVAHDFNNLLTIVLGYADMVSGELQQNPTAQEYVEQVRRAAERATSLTRQLLAFSRNQPAETRRLDLNHTVTGIEKMLRRIIGEDIELETRLGSGVPAVLADPNHLDQVILNLAVNSRDAMPGGGRFLLETASVVIGDEDASQYASLAPGRYAMLAASDTGCGMDAETRARIFDPFFTTKEAGKGTGLGLAIVYGIVKQHGGEILVYSEPGHGTTFKIYLPATDSHEAVTASHPAQPGHAGGNEAILLVEDEPAVRGLVVNMLGRRGYQVTAFASGKEALDYLRGGTPVDLLVTDVVMPSMGGVELVEAATALLPELKVLYLSGYTAGGMAHKGVLDPAAVFLQKPFDAASLAAKVREALNR